MNGYDEAIVSTRSQVDGVTIETVNHWPKRTTIASDVFGRDGFVTREADLITIKASNGARQYRVVEDDTSMARVFAELVEA